MQLATAPTILPPVYKKPSLLFRFLFFLFLRLHTPWVYTLLDNRVQGCLGLLLCSWQPHQPSSLKSHLLHFELSGAWFRRTPGFDPSGAYYQKVDLPRNLPPFGEACVCNPWNHRDPFGLFGFWFCFHIYSRGAVGILEVTAQRRHFKFAVICNLDADCTYLHFPSPHGKRLSQEPRRFEDLMFSCSADVSERRHSVDRSSGGSFRIDGLAELDGPPLPFRFPYLYP